MSTYVHVLSHYPNRFWVWWTTASPSARGLQKEVRPTRVLMPILMNPTLTSKTIDTIEWLSKCPRLNAYKYLQMLVAFNRINLSLSLWETLSPCGTVHVRKLYASTCKLYRQNGICISLLALLCLTNASRVTSLSSVGKVLSSFCPIFPPHHMAWANPVPASQSCKWMDPGSILGGQTPPSQIVGRLYRHPCSLE